VSNRSDYNCYSLDNFVSVHQARYLTPATKGSQDVSLKCQPLQPPGSISRGSIMINIYGTWGVIPLVQVSYRSSLILNITNLYPAPVLKSSSWRSTSINLHTDFCHVQVWQVSPLPQHVLKIQRKNQTSDSLHTDFCNVLSLKL
jgi:hypothetical protein